MLHITDGESVAGTLRQSGLPGDVVTYGDLLYEGPVAGGLPPAELREIRARFMADAGYASLDDARRYLEAADQALERSAQHDETVLWFDHRLSNQLMLIRALDWLGRHEHSKRLALIPEARDLGRLTAPQLASLAQTRTAVTQAQFDLASKAWAAFTSSDPAAIERVIATDTSALPFLAKALQRYLQEFPSPTNGLSRTQQKALEILRDRGPMPWRNLYAAVQQTEEIVFMGDLSFHRIVRELEPHVVLTGQTVSLR